MRLHIHVHRQQFITTIQEDLLIYDLRCKIEKEFSSLFPSNRPIVTHALSDQNHYLLPDNLVISSVLCKEDVINVILAKDIKPDQTQIKLKQLMHLWNGWQTHLATTLAMSSSNELVEASCIETICYLLLSNDCKIAECAASSLELLVLKDNSNCTCIPQLAVIELQYLNYISFAAKHSENELVRRCCTNVLYRLVCNQQSRERALLISDLQQTLVYLATLKDTQVKKQAGKALLVLHSDDPALNHDSESKTSHPEMEVLLKAVISMASKENSNDLQLISLQAVLDANQHSDTLVQTVEHLNEPLMRALHHIGLRKATSIPVCVKLTELLWHVSQSDKGVRLLLELGGLMLLNELLDRLLVQCQNVLYYDRSNPGALQFAVESIEALCFNPHVPLKALLHLLRHSSVVLSLRIATKALASLSKQSETLGSCHKHLKILIPFAMHTVDYEVKLYLCQVLSRISLKESYKTNVVKYGGCKLFISILNYTFEHVNLLQEQQIALFASNMASNDGNASDDEPTITDKSNNVITLDELLYLQRISAKSLANLSASNDKNRSTVLRSLQKYLQPSILDFQDNIVSMYLEMLHSVD